MGTAISVEGVSKSYRIGEYQAGYDTLRDSLATGARHVLRREHVATEHDFWALSDVSFTVNEGEALGIIGRNGSGKSTMLKILSRITPPTSGRAVVRGRVGSLLEVGTGFHPELTGRENVYLNGSILGMSRREITAKVDDIVDFAGIHEFMDTPVKRYSSGMYVRLAFAVAAHMDPEIMLVDEVLSVGDYEFQRRCMGRMEELSDSGRTVVFVSHDLGAVSKLCQRAVLLHGGRVAMVGPSEEVVAHYLKGATGTSSAKTWDADQAPGGERARLYGVRLVGPDGLPAESVDIRTPVRHRDPVRDPHRRQGGVPEDQDRQRERRDRLQRDRHRPAVDGLGASGRVRLDGLGARQPPQRRLSLRRRGAVLAGSAEAGAPHQGGRRRRVPHLRPGEGDSSRGLFTGTWKGAVRPLLDWTTVEER